MLLFRARVDQGSDGSKGIHRSSSITWASPSDYLVSLPGHSLGESYPSVEMVSVYSAGRADWAITYCLTVSMITFIKGFFLYFRGRILLKRFYNPEVSSKKNRYILSKGDLVPEAYSKPYPVFFRNIWTFRWLSTEKPFSCFTSNFRERNLILIHHCIGWQTRYFVLFTNPSTQAGYDTRSIFKRSLTGMNSEFSFS